MLIHQQVRWLSVVDLQGQELQLSRHNEPLNVTCTITCFSLFDEYYDACITFLITREGTMEDNLSSVIENHVSGTLCTSE